MKIKLIFQKTYFKSTEWNDVVSFFKTLKINVNLLLLSRNIFISSLKKIKENLLGECLLVEINSVLNSELFTICFDVINKVSTKYLNRLFFIGFLIEIENKLYFFYTHIIKNYFFYLNYRQKNNSSIFSINSFFLYEFFKFIKLNSLKFNISSLYVKNVNLINTFNFYY